MDLTHRFTVPAPIEEAWAAFNDLERIAPCFPGAALTSYDGETFKGLVKVKLGPISLQYTGTGRFLERDEAAHRAVIEAKGRDKRGNGTAAASVTAALSEAGEAATEVTVVTDLNITGKPAQFGRGVMQDVSDKLLAQFASCLETTMGQAPGDEVSAPSTGSDADAASAGEPATAVDGSADSSAEDETAAHTGAAAPGPAASAASTAGASTAGASTAGARGAAESSSTETSSAAIDLGMVVVPVLVRRYAVPIVAGVVGILVLTRLIRRISRRRS